MRRYHEFLLFFFMRGRSASSSEEEEDFLCADELLWVDGEALTCARSGLSCDEWFCPECIYSHACDSYCGYCKALDHDCQGPLLATDCELESLGFRSCKDWLGNGCCDDGYGYESDSGRRVDFNCPEFHCDKGDCDSCTTDKERPPFVTGKQEPWCLLLTSTVCPHQKMTHTVRRDPALRRDDYLKSLRQWAVASSLPFVVVENSAANLTALRREFTNFEFVSFRDASIEPSRGKGDAEYRAIKYALKHSTLLGSCDRVVKITGRYFLENFDKVLKNLTPLKPQVVIQSTPSPWTLGSGVTRSEVVAFENNDDLVDRLFAGQDETRHMPMERILFLALQDFQGTVAHFPPLHVPPTPNAEHLDIITRL